MGAQPCGQVSCSLASLEEKRGEANSPNGQMTPKAGGLKGKEESSLVFFPLALFTAVFILPNVLELKY